MAIIIGGAGSSDPLVGDPLGIAENDIIFGNGSADDLVGQGGNDLLFGGAGSDNLGGGGGSDTLEGGAGADILDGFGGSDWLSYAQSGGGVQIDLSASTAAGADAAGDFFSNVENVAGSGFGDQLTGGAGSNEIVGGAGGDRISGLGGNDTLRGEMGSDTLTGGAGNDVFVYFNVEESRTAGAHDVVTDFQDNGPEDLFDMQSIDADLGGGVLAYIGHNVGFGNVVGEVLSGDNGANSFVALDLDGDGAADLTINVTGVVVTFDSADFLF